MNRRSFFGFACGGILTAPAIMLAGECPSNAKLTAIDEVDALGVTEWRQAGPLDGAAWGQLNPARAFQSEFEKVYGHSSSNSELFDQMAAWCDEPVEVQGNGWERR